MIKPHTLNAYQLFHEGALALSEIQSAGMRIDEEYCRRMSSHLQRQTRRLEDKLDTYKEMKEWKAKYGEKFKISSGKQLSYVLYDLMKLKPSKYTETGQPSVDQEALETLETKAEFVHDMVRHRRLLKADGTYIQGLMKETVNGYLHPFLDLHIPATFRSSSSAINFQNQPERIDELKKIVRSAFLPRIGHRLGGIDYGGIEVKIACCYHHDPVMLKYVNDPKTDMHRDTAMEIFMLPESEVGKVPRYIAKNGFIFPSFYGSWWKECAPNIWNAITKLDAKTNSGMPLKDWLRDKGIKGLGKVSDDYTPSKGSFYAHMKDVDNRFWNERFKVYSEWKKNWMKRYERNGYVDMLTGFRCSGIMSRNQVVNYPVQGVAFHCLLWSLVELHRWMKEQGLLSKIVGQIHDEIVLDAHADELSDILIRSQQIMCAEIKEYWPWIIVPLDVEAEFGEVDENWYGIKKIDLPEYQSNLLIGGIK